MAEITDTIPTRISIHETEPVPGSRRATATGFYSRTGHAGARNRVALSGRPTVITTRERHHEPARQGEGAVYRWRRGRGCPKRPPRGAFRQPARGQLGRPEVHRRPVQGRRPARDRRVLGR